MPFAELCLQMLALCLGPGAMDVAVDKLGPKDFFHLNGVVFVLEAKVHINARPAARSGDPG